MDYCPCGSGKTWADCCKPYISGKAKAPTAEALMRSRYSAYVKQEIEYIVDTCLRDGERDIDLEQTRRWSEKSKWQGLKVLNVSKGGLSDTEGTVEFVATYEMDGLKDEHHEKAHFKKQGDSWLYVDGDIVPTTIVRSAPKQGRNEPCACGSGKKFKQCCGR